jgi:hypothetical protein
MTRQVRDDCVQPLARNGQVHGAQELRRVLGEKALGALQRREYRILS